MGNTVLMSFTDCYDSDDRVTLFHNGHHKAFEIAVSQCVGYGCENSTYGHISPEDAKKLAEGILEILKRSES
jgi:hypothetical protein